MHPWHWTVMSPRPTFSHHYTTEAGEKDYLVSQGWRDEGVGWRVAADADAPVFRLYNPYTGEHLFTVSQAEKDNAIQAGWNDEQVAFKAYTTAK